VRFWIFAWSMSMVCLSAEAKSKDPFQTELDLSPRYEYISSSTQELANRLILKSKLSVQKQWFTFYFDGFAEFDNVPVEDTIRRTPNMGYLQELYVEGKWDSIFVRLGKQALRWSETWVLPSLDIWTGRRWNRFLFDPQSEQFNHSTGGSVSYVGRNFTLDAVGITNLGETELPQPLAPTIPGYTQNNTGGGVRGQLDVAGFHFSAIGAQQATRFYSGVTGNYAFDFMVPKLEGGMVTDTHDPVTSGQTQVYFGTAGIDFFAGRWTITPQFTGFTNQNPYLPYQNEGIAYVSATYQDNPHDLQMSALYNPVNYDSFCNISYNYNLNNHVSVGGFLQSYYGVINVPMPSIYAQYANIVGTGFIAGARFEVLGDWSSR